MDGQTLVSVVVPVYNVEEYLDECIQSIIRQTYHNLEILLVDDGSTDSSKEICDNYALRDSRIIVIHKANGGNTSARKAGIEAAKGEFIIFVDSDDWIEADMCWTLLNLAETNHADVVRCSYMIENGDERRVVENGIPAGVYYTEEERKFVFQNLLFVNGSRKYGTNSSLCTQIVRRKILMNVYKQVPDVIQHGEDLANTVLILLNSKVICFSNIVPYHYRWRASSVTHMRNFHYYSQLNELYLFLYELFQKHEYGSVLNAQLDKLMDEYTLQGINRHFNYPREPILPQFMFSTNKVPLGSKIIIYGAGKVGKSYFKQLSAEKKYEISGWVDKNWMVKESMVCSPAILKEKNKYDYILVAVKQKTLYESVAEELEKVYGIESGKLIWEFPINIFDYFQ